MSGVNFLSLTVDLLPQSNNLLEKFCSFSFHHYFTVTKNATFAFRILIKFLRLGSRYRQGIAIGCSSVGCCIRNINVSVPNRLKLGTVSLGICPDIHFLIN